MDRPYSCRHGPTEARTVDPRELVKMTDLTERNRPLAQCGDSHRPKGLLTTRPWEWIPPSCVVLPEISRFFPTGFFGFFLAVKEGLRAVAPQASSSDCLLDILCITVDYSTFLLYHCRLFEILSHLLVGLL